MTLVSFLLPLAPREFAARSTKRSPVFKKFVVPPLGGIVWRHGMDLRLTLPPKGGLRTGFQGGLLVSIAVGFIGALIGVWLAGVFGVREIFAAPSAEGRFRLSGQS